MQQDSLALKVLWQLVPKADPGQEEGVAVHIRPTVLKMEVHGVPTCCDGGLVEELRCWEVDEVMGDPVHHYKPAVGSSLLNGVPAKMETGGESMMRQAQHIWSMLDDMADTDPRAYKAFIDKQMAEKKEFMSPPQPNMCVLAHMLKPQNVPFYINFCTWKRIPEPASSEEPVKVAGSAIGQIEDDKGKSAVTAVAFNEKVLSDFGKDAVNKSDQDTLIQIAMDFIERQHSHIHLNRKYKVLDRTHKGNIKVIQDSLFQAFKAKEKDSNEEMEDVMKTFGSLATDNPEKLLSELNKDTDYSDTSQPKLSEKLGGVTLNTKPVKKGLIEEISETNVSLPEPKFDLIPDDMSGPLILKVYLPGVLSVRECELEISRDDVSLYVEDKYELKLPLPQAIDDAEATAKFIKKSSTLLLSMPVE